MSECAYSRKQLHTIIQNLSDSSFPKKQIQACGSAGLFHPDTTLSPTDVLHIASLSIPTAFVLSQYRGAAERIATWSKNKALRTKVFSGSAFATLGISQLSTSHQHTSPTLIAQKKSKGWHLKGFAPWVTGARYAQYFVLGAIWNDKKALFCVHREHVHIYDAPHLVALNQSDTTQVRIDAIVEENSLLHIFGDEAATQTGSLRSIAIAMGITQQSINLLSKQAKHRPLINETISKLNKEHQQNSAALLHPTVDRIALRIRVNNLALKSAQQALVACKGKGFLIGEKAGELCTQALFFLVWSCPESVQHALLDIGTS